MQQYQASVPPTNTKGHLEPYTDAEIKATLREVFSKPAREPWTPLRTSRPAAYSNSARLGQADVDYTSEVAFTEPAKEESDSDVPPRPGDSGKPQPPIPQFDKKTGRLLGIVPTIGDTLLFDHSFARNTGEMLHVFEAGVYRDHGFNVIRQRGRELMQQWGASNQWKKGQAEEIQEWITLSARPLWPRPPLNRINLINGIYDFQNSKLEPHTPDWLSPIQLPVTYDETADCPAWDSFFEAVLPSDAFTEQIGYRLMALLMVPYTSAQRAVLLRGPRGTGKSRFLAGVRAFLGSENVSSKSLHTLEENRFSAQYLYGKLANICPDLPSNDLESTSKFKAITGEDLIDAEYKHGAQFQFQPFARLVFSANQPPTSKDASDAFLDRWWVIPFERRFQDAADQISGDELDRRLSAPRELSGVLNRAIKLLPEVFRDKGLKQTVSMKEAHDEFCAGSDPFRVWLSEYLADDPDAFEPCNEVMSSYFGFRRERGLPAMTPTAFGLELRKQKRGLQTKERTVERNGKMTKPYCYIGIRLKRKENR
jgi:putative DNA primase/helicase